MQYIFASDKEKGYGLLYTDAAKREEAQKVQQILDLPIFDGIDVFGFISFGSNNNQPLFFKVKKDVSYPRGAYFVHGIYQSADPDYYVDKRYERDLFAPLIAQEQLDEMRTPGSDGTPRLLPGSIGPQSRIPVNPDAFRELLSRVYRGEKTVVAVDDGDFSHDFVRVLMAKLFEFLPPSAVKSCTFVSGTMDVGAKNSVLLRVVPRSLLTGRSEAYLDLSDGAALKPDESEFAPIMEKLLAMSADERKQIFTYYDLLVNGYSSHYQPKKLLSFWKAILGDTTEAERLLDSYLTMCEDPTREKLPPFMGNLLSETYQDNGKFIERFDCASEEKLFRPEVMMDDNRLVLKKWYVLRPEQYQQVIAQALLTAADRVVLSVSKIADYQERIRSLNWDALTAEKKLGYQVDFYEVLCSVHGRMQNRMSAATGALETAMATVREKLSTAQPIQIVDALQTRNNVLTWCQEEMERAKKANLDILPLLVEEIDRLIVKHQQMCREMEAKQKRWNVERIIGFARGNIQSKEMAAASEKLIPLLPEMDEYADLIPPCTLEYVKAAGELLVNDLSAISADDRLVVTLAENPARWNKILGQLPTRSLDMPLLVILFFTPWNRLADCFHSYVTKHESDVNEWSAEEAKRVEGILEKALEWRLLASADAAMMLPLFTDELAAIAADKSAPKMKGTCAKFLKQFYAFCSAKSPSGKKKKSKLLPILIALVAGVAALAVAAILLWPVLFAKDTPEQTTEEQQSTEKQNASQSGTAQAPASTKKPNVPATTKKPNVPATTTKKSQVPASSAEEPNVPASSSEEPEVPASSSEEPEAPASSSEEPEVPASSSEEPEVPASSAEEPEVPASSAEEPEAPASSAEEPEVPASSSEEPEVPASSAKEPNVPASSTDRSGNGWF